MKRMMGMAGLALLAAGLGQAEATAASCPPVILDRGAVKADDGAVDPPWAKHPFRFAAFYEGDPEGGAQLTPAEELKEDRLVQIWNLAKASRVTLLCRYTGTSRTVGTPLSAGVKRCTLVTMKSGDPPPELRCE